MSELGAILADYEREAAATDPVGFAFKPLSSGLDLENLRKRMEFWQRFKKRCESPIEILYGVEIASHLGHLLTQHKIEMVPQYRWRRWRMDWAFTNPAAILFVECDGKEFHSTPDQIANDDAKDAAARSAGIQMLRFSGSEIHRYPQGCVHRTLAYLVQQSAV